MVVARGTRYEERRERNKMQGVTAMRGNAGLSAVSRVETIPVKIENMFDWELCLNLCRCSFPSQLQPRDLGLTCELEL